MDEKNKISNHKKRYDQIIKTAKHTSKEITDGLNILRNIDNEVISVFGSHVTGEKEKDYIDCEKTAYLLGKKGYAIVSGGGPGIMKAANSGAMRAKTPSIGFKAKLIQKEQSVSDSIFTHQYAFTFLFVRRYCLAVESKVLIFYPGGYGTLNELFEYITLIETHMEDNVPVICVNKKYWEGLFSWLKEGALKKGYIQNRHLDLIHFADTPEEVINIIEKFNGTSKITK
ncbi:MAG: TIGR00730 family Rossman fold protein [Candidatus Nanoarchaeia archaeon]